MAGEKLVALMQQAARGEQARSSPTDFVFGTVVSISPLIIQPEGRQSLDEDFLVLSPLVKPFVTTALKHNHTCEGCGSETDDQLISVTLWRGLSPGDRVRMLMCNGGQKFYVLDREGSFP
jgi:hypothetical protein